MYFKAQMTDGNSKFSVMVTVIFMLCWQILLPHYRPCNPEVPKGGDVSQIRRDTGSQIVFVNNIWVINEGKDELGWDCLF